jgi:hexosaminidase
MLSKCYPEIFANEIDCSVAEEKTENGAIISDTSIICAGKTETMEGVRTLLKETCELFPDSPYVHIGGDEAKIAVWNYCSHCKEYMKEHGIEDEHELYSEFVGRVARMVIDLGRTPIVWEGFPEEGADKIPKETVVISWENHYQTTHQLLAEGFRIINAAWKPMYIVPVMITQTPPFNWGQREIFDWSVYNWQHWWEKSVATENPITVEPTEQVIGAMMCAWEMTFEEEIGQVMAHLAAMSERTWSTEYRRDFLAFRDAFRHCYDLCARIIQDR